MADTENVTGNYSFWDFKGEEDYVDTWMLMKKPYTTLMIVSAYLLFVLRIGPAYMKDRSPIQMRNVLLAYNAIQVVISIALFVLGTDHILRNGVIQTSCIFQREDVRKEILANSYWYFVAKITELLDTVFFVLRKKQRQVSFLHVYHHTFVVLTTWVLMKYGMLEHMVFVGTLNSFVHICMYLYYGLSAFPGLTKYLWWKKYLTTMQLVQFVLVLIQIPVNMVTSKCPRSNFILVLAFSNGFLFIYLFSIFYQNSYSKQKGKLK